jgi:PAS domain-containing protein
MSLVNELIKGLLPENEQREVAVYGGGFKPPTKGHFDVIKKALDKNPNIDKFIVLIGGKERDGISPDESLLIWGIYKKYLPISVEIQLSSKPPIQAVYNYAKNNPEELVLFVIGAREGNEEDFKDIASRTTSLDKYPNMRLETVITKGGVSGTAARNAAKISLEKFKPFVPSELSDEEVEEVYNIVSNKVQEILTENASYSENINLKREIAKLTKHMIDKGMNIQPLPKLVFKNGDSENAKQFLGKTAYYDPNSQSIVLYTEGRHPKDIVRSFSHEMVHHTQFLEDRLGDVSTTNTMEDDNINKLEQEANLKGTMTFRNWTDSLNEGILAENEELDNLSLYSPEEIRSMDLPKEGGIYFWWVNSEAAAVIDNLSPNTQMGMCQKRDIKGEEYSLVYVGLAKNLSSRVKDWHIKQKHSDSAVRSGFISTLRQTIAALLGKNLYAQEAINDFQNKYMLVGFIETEDYKVEELKFIGSCSLPLNIRDNKTHPFYKELKALRKISKQNSLDEGIDDQLKQYIDGDVDVVDVDLLKNLLKFKSKNPEDLDPRTGGNNYGYRGMTFDKDFIKTLNVKNKSNGTTEYEVPSNTKITSKNDRGFLSFSTDEEVAKGFGHYSGYVDHKKSPDKVGGYVKVSLDNSNFILHPDYVSKLSQDLEYSKESEKETLYIGNSFNPESIYVIDKNWTDSLNEGINEYNNLGPTTPKVYIVKDDGTYKEAPIELLSKISNLTYDMGGGETNYYPEKNIVIVDNIPVEEFAKSPGEIKGEKIYVEYNLNNPTSLPKANKIIASQVVYHLDNREAFAQTVANSLKDGGTFEFNSDLMNQKDKMFLQHLSDEYGFGLPSNLNQYKSDSLPLKKGEFAEPVISYIYKITDKDGKTAKLSVTKKGKWWEYEKIDGDLDFKTGKFSTPPEDADPDFKAKKFTLRSFDKYLEYFGDSNTIVDFEKLNETSGADTAWTDDDNETITLQDILELTKNIKIVNLPTKELATIVLNWDDNPKEIERISQVEVSSQYPILIMVDDQNKIQWILDGNHRAQKALRAKSETIPAKLIKPSNLDSKARKILLNIVDEGKNKDPFGLNAYARELAMGLEENKVMDYKIYVDMDGVVADFDQRFKDLSGIGPREFEEKYGKDAFWDFIDEGENKLKFWVGIPPMSDAKQLIDFVSNYDYEMLTAPSIKKQSLMGKGLWMINQTKNGLFPFKPKINYKSAKNKKDFAAPNHILIDDREDTINSWNAAGGIGILHTSAANTISQLKKLGL